MPVPSPRNKILPARGNFSDLSANVASILDGEICYAIDQDQYYQNEGGTLVAVGATKAQGALADSAVQPGDNVSDLTNDAGYITLAQVPGDSVTSVNAQTGVVVLDADDIDDTSTAHKFTTAADISKLAGIEAGAQVNTVDSVAGKTGAVTLVKGDVGLGNVDNTSDADKPVSTATQTALDAKADLVGGVIPNSQLPSLAITEYLGTVANQAGLLALSGQRGDWAIRTDTGSTWVITTDGGSNLSDWTELATPADAVTSVNGFTGTVVLGASDVGAATAAQGATADSAVQPGDNISTLTNDAGYITSAGAPVQSVNAQTGAVVLDTDDVSEGVTNLYSQWDAATGGINYAGGNVGIGTSSPAGNLDVASVSPTIYLTDTDLTNTYARFTGNSGNAIIDARADTANGTIRFRGTGGGTITEWMRIDSSGKVGIGTSSPSANYLLTVNGAVKSNGFGTGSTIQSGFELDIAGQSVLRGKTYLDYIQGISGDTTIQTPASQSLIFKSASTERMRIDSSGNVGIGTSSPGYKVDIKDSSGTQRLRIENTGTLSTDQSSVQLKTAVSDYIWYATGDENKLKLWDANAASNRLVVDSSGNVGIGTSSPARTLHVASAASSIVANLESTGQNVSSFDLTNTGGSARITTVNDDLALSPGGTEAMRIDSSGNVGIGTSSPAGLLHAYEDSGSTISARFETAQTQSYISLTASGSSSNTANRIGVLGDDMLLLTNSSEKLRITSTGDVGINSTSPTEKLDVGGNIVAKEQNPYIKIQAGTNGSPYLRFEQDATRRAFLRYQNIGQFDIVNEYGDLTFWTGTSGSETQKMIVTSSGNVGIGTSSPSDELHISSSGLNPRLKIEATSASSYPGVRIAGTTKTYDLQLDGANDGLRFFDATASAERMRIDSSGNVGIGTSSPGAPLEVAGATDGDQLRITQSGQYYRIGRLGSAGGLLEFYGAQSGFNGYVFSGADGERMRIDSSGNVGIGTTSPSVDLEVSTASYPQFRVTDSATSVSTKVMSSPTAGTIGTHTNHDLQIVTNNTERMRIDSSGRLLVGTTNTGGMNGGTIVAGDQNGVNGSVALANRYTGNDIINTFGSMYSTGNTLIGHAVRSDTTTLNTFLSTAGNASFKRGALQVGGELIYSNAAQQDTAVGSEVTMTERMRITNAGNVGIGTDSPAGNLDVASVSPTIYLTDTDLTNTYARFTGNSGNAIIDARADTANGTIRFRGTGGGTITEWMRIDSSGNVGIGTTPAVKLDVNGEIRASTGVLFGTDTATANTLDDYEEGTWTPTFYGATTAGSYTLTVTSASYTKIGNCVTVTAEIDNITTVSAGSGVAKIGGLPFLSNSTRGCGTCTLIQFDVDDNTINITTRTEAGGGDSLTFAQTRDNAGGASVQVTDKNADTSDIDLSITYFTDV